MNNPAYYDEIVSHIENGSKVLDLGCGTGDLLERLVKERNVKGNGVDIEEEMIHACIKKGLSVFQGDLDEGLKDYESQSYDYVILNKTLQVVSEPVKLLEEIMRVGKIGIVNFPNFGYMPVRLQLLFSGRMPVNSDLPYTWYNTPNIHLCTRNDFVDLAKNENIEILKEVNLRHGKRIKGYMRNLRSTEVLFFICNQKQA